MELLDIGSIEKHPLADLHPMYTTQQYVALMLDIEKNGQKEPVVLYRGKLVDGRHRLRALKDLAMCEIKVERLPNNISLEEVKSKVMTSEVRRHQTPTQLAIKAFRLWQGDESVNQEKALAATGASRTNLKYVSAIFSKFKRPDIIVKLEKGDKYVLDFGSYVKPTDSLTAVLRDLKESKAKEERLAQDAERGFDVDVEIDSEVVAVDRAKISAIGLLTNETDNDTLDALIEMLTNKRMNNEVQ